MILATLLDKPEPPVFVHAASSTERTADDDSDESEYSRSKHEGALALRALAHDAESPVTLLRIHNTYGPGQPGTRFVAIPCKRSAEGLPYGSTSLTASVTSCTSTMSSRHS